MEPLNVEADATDMVAELGDDLRGLVIGRAALRSALRRERAAWDEERDGLTAQLRDAHTEIETLRARLATGEAERPPP